MNLVPVHLHFLSTVHTILQNSSCNVESEEEDIFIGMDVATRQHMWRVIRSSLSNSCVVLTTHSMEEADALSTRIAIMTNGRLRSVVHDLLALKCVLFRTVCLALDISFGYHFFADALGLHRS